MSLYLLDLLLQGAAGGEAEVEKTQLSPPSSLSVLWCPNQAIPVSLLFQATNQESVTAMPPGKLRVTELLFILSKLWQQGFP